MADTTVAKIRLALEGASAVEQGFAKVEQKVAGLGQQVLKLGPALLGLSGGLSVAGVVTLARNFAQAGDEIQRFSSLANTSTEQFQRMAYGSQRLGIQQEKLADILKDVQDKVGDFMQTGGGAMADFFENIAPKVGVTADQFARLGGADALQLYVSSLQKANVSQSEMTFYLEAIASDSTLLLPLLRDNGKMMGELGDQASRLGVILDDETINSARELNAQLDVMQAHLRGVGTTVAREVLPVLTALGEKVADVSVQGGTFELVVGGIANVLETVAVLGVNTNYVLQQVGDTLGGLAAVYKEFFTGNFAGAKSIAEDMRANGEIARREIDATTARILNARKIADSVRGAANLDEPWVKRLKAGSQSPVGPSGPSAADARKAAEAAAKAAERAQREAAREAAREENELLKRSAEVVALRNKLSEESFNINQRLLESARDLYAEQIKAYTDSAASVQQTLQNYLLENEAIALSESLQISVAQAVELTTIARLEEAKVAAMGSEDAVLAIQAEIDARRQLAQAINSRDLKEASTEAAEEAAEAWETTAGKIGDTLTDALMRGFESGESFGENLGDSIVNTFKTYVAKEISAAISKAILSALANSQWGSALGSMLGGTGGGGTDWISLALKGYQYMSGGSTAATAAAYGTTVGSQQTTMLMAQEAGMGTAAGGSSASAAGIGALGWAAIIAAAIYAGSELYDAGYDRTNLQGIGEDNRYSYGVENTLYKINEQTGLLNEKWANILSGTTRMAHMFGYKLHQTGIRGNFDGAGGIQTDQYESYKGGWLRGGDKVFSAPMEAERAASLTRSLADIQDSTEVLVRSMGGNAQAVRDFAGGVTIDLRGLTQSEAAQKMAEEFQDLQFRMAEAAGISRDVFADMMAMAQGLGERFGATGPAIADLLVQGMTGRLAQPELAAQMADVIMGGIYNSIASVYADPIAQMFQSQIIQPILTAALSGAPLAGIVSQATMQGVVNQARVSMATLNQIFSDPAFKQFMAELEGTIKQVSTITVQPAKHIKSFGTAALNAGRAADQAAAQIKAAWEQITDSLIDEIRRLRGVIVGDTDAGLAYTQAQFAITTARARAGSRDAAERLPEISRALEELLRENSDSLSDFRAGLAANMVSLTQTSRILARRYGIKLPSFDVGTNYVSEDMVAKVHKGEAIVPARYNPAAGGVDNAQLYRVMSELLAETKLLRESNNQVATNTRGTTDILDRVTQGGEAVLTEEVT